MIREEGEGKESVRSRARKGQRKDKKEKVRERMRRISQKEKEKLEGE